MQVKPLGKYMDQPAPDEIVNEECHGGGLAGGGALDYGRSSS